MEGQVMKKEDNLECASVVLNTVPLVMRCIVFEMHRQDNSELSMHQFGAMMFIKDHEGVSLSGVAKHHGATLSSTSKLIDGLVEREYISREIPKSDRRKVTLAVTDKGKKAINLKHKFGISFLAKLLDDLTPDEQETIRKAMNLLKSAVIDKATLD
jgi:MarR family transcriptional regulator, 2-MHQ and catechol-resistance regulon repressor